MLFAVASLLLIIPFYPARAGFISNLFHFLDNSEASKASASAPFLPLLGSENNIVLPSGDSAGDTRVENKIPLQVIQDSALVAPRNPLGVLVDDTYDEIAVYIVKSGDSPSTIAKRFGISLNTLLWANDIRNPHTIKVGDQLVILPVSGIQYEVKKGDTLEAVARRFKSKDETDISSMVADIINFNGLSITEPLEVGSMIIVPDGEITLPPATPTVARRKETLSYTTKLPEYIGYFLRPIIGGRNVRATKNNLHGLHGYNGVDLANDCGLPVMGSAEGTVILAKSTGWNGGYGKYIVITHPNGSQTLYAHLSSILVETGTRVTQGAHIGYIGSSGNSSGCHVHFEIRGAKNPF